MKFNETSIPNNYTQNVKARGYNWLPTDSETMFKVLVGAMSDFLGLVKKKDSKVALSITDKDGKSFRFAGVVAYHEGTGDMPGNYSYEITTNKEDIEDAIVYTLGDPQFLRIAASVSIENGIIMNQESFIADLLDAAAATLLQWLDINADAKEVKTLVLEGYFEANVVVENDNKIFAIIPDGAMKTRAKGDAGIESAA